MEFCESVFGSSVDGYEEVELTLSCLHLCDIDVEIANRVAFELLSGGLATLLLQVVEKCRDVEDIDATMNVSGVGSLAAARRGSRPAVVACAYERQR